MALCLTLSGSACPNLWNCLSKSGTDIANKLIQNPFWDHNILHVPLSFQLDNPESLSFNLPFAQTEPLAVIIPIDDIGKADIYIAGTVISSWVEVARELV
jgi:hypothetical protein